jgi:hypothetical protein
MTRRFDQAWDLMLMAMTLSALGTPAMAESDSKKERTEDACAAAAITEYVKANDALVQQTATVSGLMGPYGRAKWSPAVRRQIIWRSIAQPKPSAGCPDAWRISAPPLDLLPPPAFALSGRVLVALLAWRLRRTQKGE